MNTGAEPALPAADERAPTPVTPIRPLALVPDAAAQARERVVRRLAADRVRDLRDDGVTLAYIARMYGMDPEDFRDVVRELGGGMR